MRYLLFLSLFMIGCSSEEKNTGIELTRICESANGKLTITVSRGWIFSSAVTCEFINQKAPNK